MSWLDWLNAHDVLAVGGVDTRALTAMIRETGMPNAVIAHNPDGQFDRAETGRQVAADLADTRQDHLADLVGEGLELRNRQ